MTKDSVTLREAAELLGIAYPTAVKWADPDQGGTFKLKVIRRKNQPVRVPLSEIDRIKAARYSKHQTALGAGDAVRFADEVHRQLGDQAERDLFAAVNAFAVNPNAERRAALFRAVDDVRTWEVYRGLLNAISKQAQVAFTDATNAINDDEPGEWIPDEPGEIVPPQITVRVRVPKESDE